MKLGESMTLEISAVNSEGEGIARVGDENFVVFVAGALVGEKVSCKLIKVAKKYAVGSITDVIAASPARVTPRCPIYDRCGGCQLQHASYAEQLIIKESIVADALRRIGGLTPPEPIKCLASPQRWGYRNKTTIPVAKGGDRSSNFTAGYFERRSHKIVPFTSCAVLMPELNKGIKDTISILEQTGLKGYDERGASGDVRHIAGRVATSAEGETALSGIVLARQLKQREFGLLRNLYQNAGHKSKQLAGAVINIKESRDNFIWGPIFKTLYGKKTACQQLGNYGFNIDISAFFQVNIEQTEQLFGEVQNAVSQSGNGRVLELYSGVGSLTAYLASVSEKIQAVEEWRQSTKLLEENMQLNGITNVDCRTESAEHYMQNAGNLARDSYDTVVMDPPRTGCDISVTNGLKQIAPQKIVYVSCNPATLARDLARLLEDDVYALSSVKSFDMFPQTAHVETVAVLTRNS